MLGEEQISSKYRDESYPSDGCTGMVTSMWDFHCTEKFFAEKLDK